MSQTSPPHIVIIGAGIGGLTAAALLADVGFQVTVLEGQTYPGGCAGTFYHQGYRFDAGATVVGGMQPNGPHALLADKLNLTWPVKSHDPAWVVHLPDHEIALTQDNAAVLRAFPDTAGFWKEQRAIADLCWALSAQGLPWPPTSLAELAQLARVGLANFPRDMRLLPFAFRTAHQWLQARGLSRDAAFVRFIDAQLLIAAQTTAPHANALYSATALDLARQGVYHVKGGIGGLAETLVTAIKQRGGEVRYRQRVTRISVESGRANGVYVQVGRRAKTETFIPCDFVIGNLTPWSLDQLLAEYSPARLKREVNRCVPGWGAFVLHLGVQDAKLPQDLPDHHQIIADMSGPLGEGRSIFMSLSPAWDESRAPTGMRAVTVTTHTAAQPWWDLMNHDMAAYLDRKQQYTEQLIETIDRIIPGFKAGIRLVLPGTPVTYHFYTERHLGMVGGFPQGSLFRARGPHTGIPNLRLIGDSIFPGQSTAGVTLGAMRVVQAVRRTLETARQPWFQFTTNRQSSR
jgi:C-3',4' desaturase CrtD